MKWKKLLIGLIIFVILILVIIVLINKENDVNNDTSNKEKEKIVKDKLKKDVDVLLNDIKTRGDKLIVYITGDKDDGTFVESSQRIIDYYKDVYHLDYVSVNINDYSKKDLEKLLKEIGVVDVNPPIPTIVLYSKDNSTYITNFYLEGDLRNILVSNNYVKQEDLHEDVIIDYDFFKENTFGNTMFIYLSNSGKDYYEYRKYLYNTYHDQITIYSSLFGVSNTFGIYKAMQDKIKDTTIDGNCLFVVKDDKIIDYIVNFKKEEEIDSFLKKNNIVKD